MLRLVLPKGSLERATLQLFDDADLSVRRSSDVDYRGVVSDPRITDVTILRPQEIPRYVADGLFDVGVTGRDWIEETGSEVVTLSELHYSKATARPIRMVLAVAGDSEVESVADLPPGVRVHTEYPELTRRFFERHGVDARVTLSYGATEAKIPEIADAVVEITETGRALRPRACGSWRRSWSPTRADRQPRRVRGSRASQGHGAGPDPPRRRAGGEGTGAREVNVDRASLDAVIAILPALKAPTVSALSGQDAYAVETVVAKSEINTLIPELAGAGATGIIELPISKIVH